MKIHTLKRLGNIPLGKKMVQPWRKSPGCKQYALTAARHYAKRDNKTMLVIEGNMYMSRVFHITRDRKASYGRFGHYGSGIVYCVLKNGDIYRGIVGKIKESLPIA